MMIINTKAIADLANSNVKSRRTNAIAARIDINPSKSPVGRENASQ